MKQDLDSLRIDKSLKASRSERFSKWWIIGGIALFLLLGAYNQFLAPKPPVEVRVARATATGGSDAAAGSNVVLQATGYIVAHHKIQLASKVVGKVAWIGVEKGDRVQQGQVIVRLEDDEYRAQLQQAKGNLAALEARLQELLNGSRPEEVQVAKANLDVARADLENAKVNLHRAQQLSDARVLAKQAHDDAKARHDSAVARVASLERTYELVRVGPRQEAKDQVRGQIDQAKGQVAYFETQLANTVIKAPVTGTILERAVERGEFVTTSFVGERGAKGYVVSMADLNDLQVELDINQSDFAKLSMRQKGIVTTDAFRDRKYDGVIEEMSPEANRAKATVQVKVKVVNPDEYLRPEMNASVSFIDNTKPVSGSAPVKPAVLIPASAVKGGSVWVIVAGKAMRKSVRAGAAVDKSVRVEDGLLSGEDVILDPPETLKEGDRVQRRQ